MEFSLGLEKGPEDQERILYIEREIRNEMVETLRSRMRYVSFSLSPCLFSLYLLINLLFDKDKVKERRRKEKRKKKKNSLQCMH